MLDLLFLEALFAIGAAGMAWMDFRENQIYPFLPMLCLPGFLWGWGTVLELQLVTLAWIFVAVLYWRKLLPIGDVLAVPFLLTTPHMVLGLEAFVAVTAVYLALTRQKWVPLAGLVGLAMLIAMI